MSFDFSTLVTDRTQADVNRVKQIAEKIKNGTASESELAEFNSAAMKGAYNYTDLNRVTAAMEALKAKLEGYGYAVPGYQRIKVPHVLPEPEPNSRLPEGYLELTYIESTGAQYIDTDFISNQYTRVVMDAQFTSTPTEFAALFGARGSTSSQHFVYYNQNQSKFSLRFGGGTENFVSVTPTGRNMFDLNKNTLSVGSNSITAASATFSASCDMYLFAIHDAVENAAGEARYLTSFKLFACQIYDNGVLVRDFVPCKNASGVAGLYDIANGVFYQNAGTGTFTAGEEVVAPATASVMVTSGNADEYDPYTWYEFDWPTPQTMTIYLLNVSAIRAVLAVMKSTPSVPVDMERLLLQEANNIEIILSDVLRQLTIMPTTFIPAGEALCGGDNL